MTEPEPVDRGLGDAEPAGGLSCVPEWCEKPNDGHDPTCPEHPVVMTKAEFVASHEGGAQAAIETYRELLDGDEISPEEAMELAIGEAHEGSVCFIGIGSCGRGWCKHS